MDRNRLLRAALVPVVVPHELGHALPAAAAGLEFSIELAPEWDRGVRPLGRFDAALAPATPLWLIRLVAVAPLPLYVGLAAVVGLTTALPAPVEIGVVVACSVWGSLSGGDLAVAADPDTARRAGELLVGGAGWEPIAADVLTIATTLLVAVLVLVPG